MVITKHSKERIVERTVGINSFSEAKRLAKMLGFTCEGTMKKYYNGLDFNIWGRVK